jgi:SAM-dependent methyltransferase
MADDHALYVQYYDAMFSDKPYASEAESVLALYRETTGTKAESVFDVGCGTGRHAMEFHQHGCHIVGWDEDAAMLAITKSKGIAVGYPAAPVDLVTALFHVANYCLMLERLDALLRLAYDNLRPGGMFVSDAWDADVFASDPPSPQVREYTAGEYQVVRHLRPRSLYRTELVKVSNDTAIYRDGEPVDTFTWQYTHRVWKPAMIADRLKAAGFTRQLEPRRWGKRDLLFAAVR